MSSTAEQPTPSEQTEQPPSAMHDSISDVSSYDMLDDVSDLSSDDHDTVSLASTEQGVDDSPYDQIDSILDDMRSLPVEPLEVMEVDKESAVSVFISETPEESTVTIKPSLEQSSKDLSEKATTSKPASEAKTPRLADILNLYCIPTLAEAGWSVVLVLFLTFLYMVVVQPLLALPQSKLDRLTDHLHRQDNLSAICARQYSQHVNTSHLLPLPSGAFGLPVEVRFQAVDDSILVSLPKILGRWPEAASVKAWRTSGENVTTSLSTLMPGVHAVDIKDAAYGAISVVLAYKEPPLWIQIEHDFGRPLLQAVRALSQRVNTDLAVFIDQATTSAHKIESRTKELTKDSLTEMKSLAKVAKDDLRQFTLNMKGVEKVLRRDLNALASTVKHQLRRDVQLSRKRAKSIATDLKKSLAARRKQR